MRSNIVPNHLENNLLCQIRNEQFPLYFYLELGILAVFKRITCSVNSHTFRAFGQKTHDCICKNICCKVKNCEFTESWGTGMGFPLLCQFTHFSANLHILRVSRVFLVVFMSVAKASSEYIYETV